MNFMYNGKNILAIVRDLTDTGLAEIAMKIAETHPDVFAQAVLGEAGIHQFTLDSGGVVRLTQSQLNSIDLTHDKIVAIKNLREWFSISLRDAKLLSETLARDGYVKRPTGGPKPASGNWVGGAPTPP